MTSSRARKRFDEIEARLREMGAPDVDGWRARVEANMAAYERAPRPRRLWWRLRGFVDSIRVLLHIAVTTAAIDRRAHEEFLARHPDYAAALAHGDKKAALQLLAKAMAEDQTAVMATPSYRGLLRGQLREQGFGAIDVAAVDAMLGNVDHDKRKN